MVTAEFMAKSCFSVASTSPQAESGRAAQQMSSAAMIFLKVFISAKPL